MITLEDTQGSPYYNITAFTRNGAMCRFSSPLHRFRVQDSEYCYEYYSHTQYMSTINNDITHYNY